MSLLTDHLARCLRALLSQAAVDGADDTEINQGVVADAHEALGIYDNQADDLNAAEILVHAYARGESRGGSVDWDDLNRAWDQAKIELGPKRVEEIESCYTEPDLDGPDTGEGEDDGHPVAT